MGILIVLLILAFIGWAAFTQIAARQQTSVSCPYDVATARAVVAKCFGRSWASVAGKGDLNYKPRMRATAPVISVSFDAAGHGGTEVDIWCSAFTTRYGLLAHGQLVWRKKRAVARALVPVERGLSQAPVQEGDSRAVPPESQQSQPRAESQQSQPRAQPRIDAFNRVDLQGSDRIPAQIPDVRASGRQDLQQPGLSGLYSHQESPATNGACAHTPAYHMEFGDIKVKGDPPYRYRDFWHVTACTKCGAESNREADEYYGDDMAEIHWKWRQ